MDKIGELKPANGMALLLPFLSDNDPELRSDAVFNLGALGERGVVPYFIEFIRIEQGVGNSHTLQVERACF